jgi:tetratricopeptide (TPR) repeat protein
MSDLTTHDLTQVLQEMIASNASPQEFTRRLFNINVVQARASDPLLAEVMPLCAIPSSFDAAIIGVLRDAPDDTATNERLLSQLASYNYVQSYEDGSYAYHDTVREMLLEHWQQPEHKEEYEQITRRLADFYFERGKAHANAKDYEAAFTDINNAIDLFPENADFVRSRAQLYLSSGQHDPALNDFTLPESLVETPDFVPFLCDRRGYWLHLLVNRLGSYEALRESFQHAHHRLYNTRGALHADATTPTHELTKRQVIHGTLCLLVPLFWVPDLPPDVVLCLVQLNLWTEAQARKLVTFYNFTYARELESGLADMPSKTDLKRRIGPHIYNPLSDIARLPHNQRRTNALHSWMKRFVRHEQNKIVLLTEALRDAAMQQEPSRGSGTDSETFQSWLQRLRDCADEAIKHRELRADLGQAVGEEVGGGVLDLLSDAYQELLTDIAADWQPSNIESAANDYLLLLQNLTWTDLGEFLETLTFLAPVIARIFGPDITRRLAECIEQVTAAATTTDTDLT